MPTKKTPSKLKCPMCGEPLNTHIFYPVMVVVVKNTDGKQYTLSIQEVEASLAKEFVKAGIHLSVTQCLLYRPDVIDHYFDKQLNQLGHKLESWVLFHSTLCKDCFEDYKEGIPLR